MEEVCKGMMVEVDGGGVYRDDGGGDEVLLPPISFTKRFSLPLCMGVSPLDILSQSSRHLVLLLLQQNMCLESLTG